MTGDILRQKRLEDECQETEDHTVYANNPNGAIKHDELEVSTAGQRAYGDGSSKHQDRVG